MTDSKEDLMQRARDFSWWMFNEAEIAQICNVPQELVERVKNDPKGPFFFDLCRPEWFAEWMRRHSKIAQLNHPDSPLGKTGKDPANSNPWAEARRPSQGGQRER
jgi:hypothetical protein